MDNKNTDKNTRHSYLDVYGWSAKLWLDYFKNVYVYILDILKEDFYKGDMLNTLKSYDKLKLFLDTNA